MAGENVKRYVYRNKITGAEFLSSSICSGGAWELIKTIRPAAKQPTERKPRRREDSLIFERYDENDE